ncbi:hypothetical protein J4208_05750 [Candidatus Woesearchaeota archaeon]|nr:hypothetical protein [Candidatus Woesearchaeota archaeon]
MKSVKKGEETLVTTAFSNTRSLLTFLVAVLVLLGLFVILYNYSNLVEEKTIVINSDTDLSLAKQTLQGQVEKLERKVGELRALVT